VTDLQLVLASQSPRRRNLLERLSIRPSIEPADVDETPEPEERPEAYVERLARTKASASLGPGRVVIAADTVVVRDGVILGKPRDRADAIDILRSLSGRSHQVLSGVAVAVTDPDGSSRVAARTGSTGTCPPAKPTTRPGRTACRERRAFSPTGSKGASTT
jgi:septum formation protein